MEIFKNFNIASKQGHDDADVLIVETVMEESIVNTTVLIGEDIDHLVLLTGCHQQPSCCCSHQQQQLFFMKPGKGEIKTVLWFFKLGQIS